MLFYKVVEVKQKSFARGYMTSTDLQNVINQWAYLGWTLDRITSAETQALLHTKDVFLLIFKRDAQIPEGLCLMVNNQAVQVSRHLIVELHNKKLISPTTLSCRKGMKDWQPLGAVAPDLAEAIATQ